MSTPRIQSDFSPQEKMFTDVKTYMHNSCARSQARNKRTVRKQRSSPDEHRGITRELYCGKDSLSHIYLFSFSTDISSPKNFDAATKPAQLLVGLYDAHTQLDGVGKRGGGGRASLRRRLPRLPPLPKRSDEEKI